ncbi:MAG: hypothetical protein NTU81_02030 [Candidatus Nomurabacteria bacterium]|nr:hypothetical protein [Candidatus Nomurabacteria bacterium]
MSLFSGTFIFIITAIIILYVCIDEMNHNPYLYLLWGFHILGAILLGNYFYHEKPNYSWLNLKEGEVFEIESVGADFAHPTIFKKTAPAVVRINSFGITILMLPTAKYYWDKNTPKKGDRFVKVNDAFRKLDKK